MDLLRKYLRRDFCSAAARHIFALERSTVLLATGFYVAGFAETDGPPGTYFLAKALRELGFRPVILADDLCRDFFPDGAIDFCSVSHGLNPDAILDEYQPVCLISTERCGKNIHGDYANMRGVSIKEHTPEIDSVFECAMRRNVYTVGIGDGGNEIGMGNVADVITKELSLVPCKVRVSELIIATVSNWGAYGLIAELSLLAKRNLFTQYQDIHDYINYIVSHGSGDGVTKQHVPTVDGFNASVEQQIVDDINLYIESSLNAVQKRNS